MYGAGAMSFLTFSTVSVETYNTDYLDTYYGGTFDYGSATPVHLHLAETTDNVNFSLISDYAQRT